MAKRVLLLDNSTPYKSNAKKVATIQLYRIVLDILKVNVLPLYHLLYIIESMSNIVILYSIFYADD